MVGHAFSIVDIVINDVDQHVISVSVSSVVRVWDLHTLAVLQVPKPRSSSLVTLARPSRSSSLRITDRSFQYASSLLSGLHLGLLKRPCSNNRLSNNRPRFVSIEPLFGKKFEELHNSVGHYYYCCMAAVWGGERNTLLRQNRNATKCTVQRLLHLHSSAHTTQVVSVINILPVMLRRTAPSRTRISISESQKPLNNMLNGATQHQHLTSKSRTGKNPGF